MTKGMGMMTKGVHMMTESVRGEGNACTALNDGGVVASYGWDQHLGAGWFATGWNTPAEVCPEVCPYGPGMGLSRSFNILGDP